MLHEILRDALPAPLHGLSDLAMDLRFADGPEAGRLWEVIDRRTWLTSGSATCVLLSAEWRRLEQLARDRGFLDRLAAVEAHRRAVLDAPRREGPGVAYLSMEFGLSSSLPIYSGGLGVLAGDHLKSASDEGLPLTGIGLLYQHGYFRQEIDAEGHQREIHPTWEPSMLPVRPAHDPGGRPLDLRLAGPGGPIRIRAWEVTVGRVRLYLMDTNHPANRPADRTITEALYPAEPWQRLAQEIVLGVAGWALAERLGALGHVPTRVCHLNEGHAAFAVVARAARWAAEHGTDLDAGLWATRAGNVFTTHTPVPAAFDRFDRALVARWLGPALGELGCPLDPVLELGRDGPDGASGDVNMAHLALRGAGRVNGVSMLHGEVSRALFAPLFPRWPIPEVPIGAVTNGIHTATWRLVPSLRDDDDPLAPVDPSPSWLADRDDEELWVLRRRARLRLIEVIGLRDAIGAEHLDPDVLTLGYARRFATYKRPTLLAADAQRLRRLMDHHERPVQLVIAGKAHPRDQAGRDLVRAMAELARRVGFERMVFVADDDIALTRALIAGVDVWINTPRRPLEACGTSGMKILANGGLHCSTLDGWWAEAHRPGLGWAIGDGRDNHDGGLDEAEAAHLLELLETEVVPAFYDRDGAGLPRSWIERIRASIRALAEPFDSGRMVRTYLAEAYEPAAAALGERRRGGAAHATRLRDREARLDAAWERIELGRPRYRRRGDEVAVELPVHLGDLGPEDVAVELYADPTNGHQRRSIALELVPDDGREGRWLARGTVPADRPVEDHTPRIVPHRGEALVPLECDHIRWPDG